MHRIPPCSRIELIRKLRELGFKGPFSGGKHSYMIRGKDKQIVPNPQEKDISSVLIKEMLKQSDIPIEEWLDA